MEADWEAEIGEDLPKIELPWSGYVDLRQDASAIDRIEEAVRHPALAEALQRLNAAESSLVTAKCDVWLAEEPVDGYEFDAGPHDAQVALASYIDVMLRDAPSFGVYEAIARKLVAALHKEPLKNGRVDCILRGAWIDGADGFGMTLYVTGCGADAVAAEERWKAVLRRAVDATIAAALLIRAGE
ncbi:hypothetical protein [Silvibacterium acidisoli]|uniref:hypothetical protein n=1 Tax=Acidobacteriaceae bacterium ZG23-2 TaxID=2883246 RepID=UPI00406C5D3B